MKCDHCGKEISKGDEYISVADQKQRYCQGCFSTDTTTNYYVGGEYVGNDNCVDEYDSYGLEEESK